MKRVLRIIGLCIAGFLVAAFIAAVIGRGVTGSWNPVEWGNSKDTSMGGNGVVGKDGKDGETPYIGENGNWFIGEIDTGVRAEGKDGKDGETPYIGEDGNWHIGAVNTGVAATIYVEPVNPHLITEFTELTFVNGDTVYNDCGRWLVSNPSDMFIFGTNGNEACAYFTYDSAAVKKLYRNTLFYGLKMETDTEITFETGVPMTLYLWLDKVEVGAHATSTELPSTLSINIDRSYHKAQKVTDDEIGYTLSIYLPAGEHTIRKGDTCVLSYLSLTP